jgi:hypothetical protein
MALATSQKTVLVMGYATVTLTNQAGNCTYRLRYNTAGACGTGSSAFAIITVPYTNTTGLGLSVPIMGQLAPASTADVSYCLTLQCVRAYSWSNAHISIVAGAP